MKISDIRRVQAMLRTFRNVKRSMRLDACLMLLEVAGNPAGISIQVNADKHQVSHSAGSRHITDLEELGYVMTEADPSNHRFRLAKPTPKLERILSVLEQELK